MLIIEQSIKYSRNHKIIPFKGRFKKNRHQHVFSYKAKITLPHSCLQVTIRTSIEE